MVGAMSKDYYSILGVTRTVSDKDLRKAYKKLARQYHPDKNSEDGDGAAEMFKSVARAYEVLSDPEHRWLYDQYGEEGMEQALNGHPPPPHAQRFRPHPRDPRRPGPHPHQGGHGGYYSNNSAYNNGYQQQRGPPPQRKYSDTASSGGPPPQHQPQAAPGSGSGASTASGGMGTGAKTSTASTASGHRQPKPSTSPPFKEGYGKGASGSGYYRKDSYPSSSGNTSTTNTSYGSTKTSPNAPKQQPPPVMIDLPCTLEEVYNGCRKKMKITKQVMNADGTLSQQDKFLIINVKKGWKNGTKITFEKEGDQGPNLIPADVVFVVQEQEHSGFRREGADLIYRMEVPLLKALTGFNADLRMLDDRVLSIPVTDIVSPGSCKVVAGEGMPRSKDPSSKGDLKIKFKVKFPDNLNDDQKTLLQAALG